MKKTHPIHAAILLALAVALYAHAFTPIPLGGVANRDLVDEIAADGKGGWSDQGPDNSLTGFPRGEQEFAGIPFSIPAEGPAVVMLKGEKQPDLPPKVTIPGGAAQGRALYILCGYVWGAEDKVARVTVAFENGQTQEVELKWDTHISGWWGPEELDKAVVAWTGVNKRGVTVGVYLTAINLDAREPIESVTFRAAKNEGSLALLGLTVGDKPAEEILPQPLEWVAVEDDVSDWFPLDLSYDKGSVGAWEVGYDFHTPAGSLGWLKADGENLVFDEGRPIRFKGATMSGYAFYPSKKLAARFARILKKYGFNQVRFHSLMDIFLTSGVPGDEALEMKASRLDKFDFFFNELKQAGIYTKVSLIFCHLWGPDTGIEQWDKLAALNNTQYFYDERHQELYLDFLRQFLAHTNQYTGLTYAQDPAFSMIKVVNESSMFFNTVDAVPPYYRLKLQDRWNQWLKEKYGDDIALAEAWRVEGSPPAMDSTNESFKDMTYALRGVGDMAHPRTQELKRVADQTRFYYELETTWFQRVYDLIRETGSHALVQGSSWGGPGHLQELQTAVNAQFDFSGKHSYWLHPHGGWTPIDVSFANKPITRSPRDNIFMFAYQRPAGLPFACTEWNFCYPNDYTLEAAPFMAAYGALQNFNATHRFNASTCNWPGFLNSIFGMFDNPATVILEPLAYFLFVRGDVKPAELIYRNALTEDDVHDATRKLKVSGGEQSKSRFYMKFGGQEVPTDACFIGKVELSLDPEKYPAVWNTEAYQTGHDEEAHMLRSTTGELLWNYGEGWIDIDTPRTKGVMGFLSNRMFDHNGLRMQLNDAYGVVHFSSLDDLPLNKTGSILVSLVGRTRNTGQKYDRRGTDWRLAKQGDGPILMEPVSVECSLDTTHKQWRLTPLDLNGNRIEEKRIELTAQNNTLDLSLSNKDPNACLYLLEADPLAINALDPHPLVGVSTENVAYRLAACMIHHGHTPRSSDPSSAENQYFFSVAFGGVDYSSVIGSAMVGLPE